MRKYDLNVHVFENKSWGLLHSKDFKWKKNEGAGLVSDKAEALYAELNKRAEAATSSYSATGEFLQYIYSVLVAKNHQKIRSRCLVHELSFTDIFNDINHGYRAALLKKDSLWLLPFYKAVASYCCYEKVRRTMCTAMVSYVLKYFYSFLAAKLDNTENEDKAFARDFLDEESDFWDCDDEYI